MKKKGVWICAKKQNLCPILYFFQDSAQSCLLPCNPLCTYVFSCKACALHICCLLNLALEKSEMNKQNLCYLQMLRGHHRLFLGAFAEAD